MSLLPDSASFHERVEACFVAYRGRGLSLSSMDYELVDAWAQSGVPFEVVARGLRKAAERALWDAPEGEGQLRSLKAARKLVEAEIQKYLKRAPSSGLAEAEPSSEPFHLVRHGKLRAALKKLAREHEGAARVVAHLDARPPPEDFEAANRLEELALALLLRSLPPAERSPLLREARRLMEKAQVSSAAARLESLRFHRAALVRHRWAIPAFW
jgi:hypothetical protein